MDAQILIDQAKRASNHYVVWNHQDRLAFQVGYLEQTIKELCNILENTEKIMYRQRELIEEMKKGYSTDL